MVSNESKAEAMKLGGGGGGFREHGWILEELWGGVEEHGQRALCACMKFSKNEEKEPARMCVFMAYGGLGDLSSMEGQREGRLETQKGVNSTFTRLRASQDVEGGRKTGYIPQKSWLGYNGAVLKVTRCRGCARQTPERRVQMAERGWGGIPGSGYQPHDLQRLSR